MLREVLYLDDNPGEAFLLREAVRKLNDNIRPVTAGDGEVALAHLLSGRERPCVIVLDLNVPRLDGRQVLKAVKSHHRLKTVPTVVFAETAARKEIQLTEYAPDLFLSKPMDLEGYMVVAEKIIALCASSD